MNESPETRRNLAQLFDIGLIIKVVFSTLEIIGGLLVLVVPRTFIVRIAEFATQGELARDPNDPVASAIVNYAHTFAVHAHDILAIYLLARGMMKAVLAGLILAGSKHAYPLFVAALGLFAWYESYRAITTSNILLGGIAVFDLGLILLTAHEYRVRYSSSG